MWGNHICLSTAKLASFKMEFCQKLLLTIKYESIRTYAIPSGHNLTLHNINLELLQKSWKKVLYERKSKPACSEMIRTQVWGCRSSFLLSWSYNLLGRYKPGYSMWKTIQHGSEEAPPHEPGIFILGFLPASKVFNQLAVYHTNWAGPVCLAGHFSNVIS